MQKEFSWAGVAVGAIAGGVSSALGAKLVASDWDPQSAQYALATGLAGGVAGAAARSLIDGSNFGDNLIAALPDIIGNTIGGMIAGGLSAPSPGEGEKSPIERLFGAAGDLLGLDGKFGYQGHPDRDRTLSLQNLGKAFAGLADAVGDTVGFDGQFGYQGTVDRELSLTALGSAASRMTAGSAQRGGADGGELAKPKASGFSTLYGEPPLEEVREYLRSTGNSWAYDSPSSVASAPRMIDLSPFRETFDQLMANSYPEGLGLEDGASIFGNREGRLVIDNIHGDYRDPGGGAFFPDLNATKILGMIPSGLKLLGLLHTHPYTIAQDGRNYSATFSGRDLAQMMNQDLNFSIAQSNDSQWMVVRTDKTPRGSVDANKVEKWTQDRTQENQAKGLSFPDAQFETIKSLAKQYNMALYAGSKGKFYRVDK